MQYVQTGYSAGHIAYVGTYPWISQMTQMLSQMVSTRFQGWGRAA